MKRIFWLLLLLTLMKSACALKSNLPLTQLSHGVWRVKDGVLAGAPSALAQTSDGYMWIGTRGGLYRFDGIRFVPFAADASAEPLRSPRIISLKGTSDGSLWIGSGAELARWKDGQLTHYPSAPRSVVGYINQIVEAKDGRIWMARSRVDDREGPLCAVTGAKLKCYGKDSNMPLRYVSGFLEDREGRFWAHSDDELVRWDPRTQTRFKIPTPMRNVADGIQTLTYANDGSLLVGSTLSGQGAGILQLQGQSLEPFVTTALDGRTLSVHQLFVDSQKSLWIGTQSMGLYRVKDGFAEHYDSTNGLSGNTIYHFLEDREGNVWVATSQGVDRFSDIKVTSYSRSEGLASDVVTGVVASRDGSIWIGNYHAIGILENGNVRSMKGGKDLPGDEVTALFEDRSQRMWIGLDDGLVIYDKGTFKKVMTADGQPVGVVRAMDEDKQGNVWVLVNAGAVAKVLRLRDDQIKQEFPFSQLPVARVDTIAADSVAGVWVALQNGDVAHLREGSAETIELGRAPNTGRTSSIVASPEGTIFVASLLGVVGIRGGVTHSLTAANGLPCDIVWSMLVNEQALWLYTQCGLVSVEQAEIKRWWHDPQTTVKFSQIGPLDGVQAAQSSRSPGSARSPDGRLWFANSSALQMYDPANHSFNRVVPPVLIERLTADGKSYPPTATHVLPALTRNVEIDYTGLSFVVPEKVNFRYKLEGYDDIWTEAKTRRQAFYTNLKPGKYTFKVTASNNDGVWNSAGGAQAFEVLPAFYQTTWFALLSGLAGLTGLWAIYRLRLRWAVAQMKSQQTVQLQERERIARELHDTLLQSVQALGLRVGAVADELPHESSARMHLTQALDIADDALAEGRAQISGLRSEGASPGGLDGVLAELALEARRCDLEFRQQTVGRPQPLRLICLQELRKLLLEAMRNAIRHAGCRRIDVAVRYSSQTFEVTFEDDGRGMDMGFLSRGKEGHWGLQSMRERIVQLGGVFQLTSEPGHGTKITVRLRGSMAYQSASAWYRRLLRSRRAADSRETR